MRRDEYGRTMEQRMDDRYWRCDDDQYDGEDSPPQCEECGKKEITINRMCHECRTKEGLVA